VDDAVHSVKAALDEGIVAGGGVTMVNLTIPFVKKGEDPKEDRSISAGRVVLFNSLLYPFRTIMTNAGLNTEAKLEKVIEAKEGMGFDVNSPEKLVDLKSVGVVDPVRVVREAIQNAVSIAGTAMTMGALVVDVPEKAAPAAPDMGGGMGMM
jgi:chaperonin GroEL